MLHHAGAKFCQANKWRFIYLAFMQTTCRCAKENCPLNPDWLAVTKLYNENITVKQMAELLGKTENQIYKYQRKTFKKLGLPTITHAVLYCGKRGCI